MKILFCSHLPLTKNLGATKVVVELAEALQEFGWEAALIGPGELFPPETPSETVRVEYPARMREYLQKYAREYDVIDYDHAYLPFPRQDFPESALFVARSVLLVHHLETIPIPGRKGVKAQFGTLVKRGQRQRARQQIICLAQTTVESADLVNVSNEDDRAELIRRGIAPQKIVVIPYGISQSRKPVFEAVSSETPTQPGVAFVGTFDYRKGAREFPAILQGIAGAVPEVRFRLLGTGGLFPTEADVLAHFPKGLRPKIDVVSRYRPEELPSLLASCSVGIFPSYMEGMPFGVLEMLAASVPVIAYDAPGPPMMLPPEYLVRRGDFAAMSRKVAALLQDAAALSAARVWAKQRSQEFLWEKAAQMTAEVYRERWQEKQRGKNEETD